MGQSRRNGVGSRPDPAEIARHRAASLDTTYAYDTENNLTDIWDANNNHTQFLYYPGQYLYKTIFPSTEYETYGFDGDNNLEYRTDRNGNTINYAFDQQNHLYYKSEPNGYSVTYTYDPAARLTEVEDANAGATGTYTFTYDNMNRLASAGTNYSFLSAGTLTVQYGYDKASNRTSMTDPQSETTVYGYDTLNRLTSLVFNGQSPGFGFGYDGLNRRISLTRPNGINTTYNYDPVSRLLSVLHKLGTTTLDGATYTYDNAGNRKPRNDQRTNTQYNYTYDTINQLKMAKLGSVTKETYSYDLVGNRLTSFGVSPYNYNSSNELTSTPSGNYTYDANGNTLSDPSGKQYSWDFENRMVSATVPGTGTVNFKYDPFGRRIQKASPLGTTNYLYDGTEDGANLIEELDNAGNILARYTNQLDVDTPLSMLRSGTPSYYEQDGLGSVTSLSNSAGALVNTYTYDSFGKLTASTGTLVNPFQYTGREFDPETGLYEYRARYYDQNVGRFKSEDPIRFGGGINFYRYAGNNAINRSDPDGMGAAECLKALERWALAYAEVNRRLGLFNRYGDMDAGHAQALEEALNHLEKETENVKAKCNCDLYKAEVAAAVAATVAPAARVAAALMAICSETPVCALAENNGSPFPFPEDKQLPFYIAHADGEPGHGKVLGHVDEALLKESALYLAVAG